MTKLTAIFLKSAPPGKHGDGGGLELRKTETGGKWVMRYSFAGKRREMGLGSYPGVGLSDARKMRDRWAQVKSQGKDPISERRAQMNAARTVMERSDPSLAELSNMVLETKRDGLKGGGKAGRWMSPLERHVFPKIGSKPISMIQQADIHNVLTPIWRTKHPTAEKAIQRLRIIFRRGKLMGFQCDPFTIDAAQHMLGEVIHQSEPIVATPWQEIPGLYRRLEGRGTVAACLQFMMLTVVRSAGCRSARFDEVKDGVWTVPAERMKGKVGKVRDFRVPLSVEAMKIIGVMREHQAAMGNEFIFAGARSKPITDVALSKHLNLLNETGRAHGFRTSFRTWVQDTDATTWEVSETVLAHTIGGKVERSYARSDLLDRRKSIMESWAAFITGTQSDVVSHNG